MERRSFLKAVGAGAGALAAVTSTSALLAATRSGENLERVQGLPHRVLGRTGRKVSVVGYPALAMIHQEQPACTDAVRRAFDMGINYFDVAPAYGDGVAETRLGVALQELKRDQIFLACKTKMRDAKGAREELERSLQRLKTDHFDLYQMHHVVSEDQVKQAFGPGGAFETFVKAKEEGKVRWFGFSAHTTKGAAALMRAHAFDTVMFPINFVEYFTRGFGKELLDLANQQGAAVLAIKAMSRGLWAEGAQRTRAWWYQPVEDPKELDLALRFALSLKGVVAAFPPAFVDLAERAVEVCRAYRELTLAEMNDLVKLAWDCRSVFKREEEQFAGTLPYPHHPTDPHPDEALA